tara:strand:- start:105 stop:476 length:372 start_codon:yes stop_codon:yes gene_type:complete
MVTFLINLEKIIFYIYNPFLWIFLEIMNRSENFKIDKEKIDIKEKERKEFEKETGTKLENTDDMNLFDWLYYILLPIGFVIFILGFVFKLYYNSILIPVLKKSALSVEQQLQFEKIKNRLILK